VYGGEDAASVRSSRPSSSSKGVSIDDAKNINDHPAVDVREQDSRLLKALETLKLAPADADDVEDNPVTKGLKHRVLDHLDPIEGAV
jgi:hypothetical protein